MEVMKEYKCEAVCTNFSLIDKNGSELKTTAQFVPNRFFTELEKKNELKEEIEHKIKWCDEWIEAYQNDDTKVGKFTLEFYKEKKRLFQESLKEYFR